ncbi:MAG: cobaltochelatase subunit CobN, partial [Salinarimonas sp.]
RLALILSTYPGREDQHAHAIGLDAPASAVGLYDLLAEHGYATGTPPGDGDALVAALDESRITWPLEAYRKALATLPQSLRAALDAQWGAPEDDPDCRDGAFHFRALAHGGMITALQPERGSSADRAQEYHDLARAPRHAYVAFYLWLRHGHGIDALIHLGAHGTLEWLPGKAVALSEECWPQALTGSVPVIYPFIVNDPGEAATAKRRIGALTIGHMTPPVRSGVMPDALHGLERLLDEYSTADGLDPRRRDRLVDAIIEAAQATQIVEDLQITPETCKQEAIARVDAFVCDIKETQFTDGLHVFGKAVPADGADIADDLDPHALATCPQGEREALIAALDGRFVAPGPAGSPWRGRRDVLPTGRNLFAVDPRAVPSRAAVEQGTRMAETLVMRHLQDHGDYPQGVVVDLWGSATMRTAGEDFAMAMRLIGAQPVWDHGSHRISGFEILAPAILGRPRIAVTLRISGLFRDVFPGLADLFEQAVAALRKRNEPDGENPYYGEGTDAAHVYGPAPGSYGAGVAHLEQDFSRETIDQAGQDWLAASAFAYGGDKVGRYDKAGLAARVAQASAYVHAHDLAESDLLSAPDYAQHQGGFAAAARSLR